MADKMDKDITGAGEFKGCLIGFMAALVFSLLLNLIFGVERIRHYEGALLLLAFAVGIIAYWTTKEYVKQTTIEESNRENQAIERMISSGKSDSVTDSKTVDRSIQLMCRASYLGGHKKYGGKSDVTVVLTQDRLLIKELPGHPEIRIDIPYNKVSDFGVGTKEQLSGALLVGMFAFTSTTTEQYLYIKYKDHLGFESNPLLGGFAGAKITDVNSTLYSLIEKVKYVEYIK
jgi:hypothetical protein